MFINKTTKQLIQIDNFILASGTISLIIQQDKYSDIVPCQRVLENIDIDRYNRLLLDELKKLDEFKDCIPIEDYVDWPEDTELPEYLTNYRIHVIKEKTEEIMSKKAYRDMLAKVPDDCIIPTATGKYVYLTTLEPYHPWVIREVLGLIIEKNPTKEVPEIDYTPPPTI